MDREFWLQAWSEGRTGFHRSEFHPQLLDYFPELAAESGQRILVPLCGKSLDLLWLSHQDLYVHGIEFSEKAVLEFFKENHLDEYQKEEDKDFIHYTHQNLTLSSGDFFHLSKNDFYHFIYDRAALVALPEENRITYAFRQNELLTKGGKILLITFEYDQSKLSGPPFSVTEEEVHKLYPAPMTIEKVHEKTERPKNPKFKENGIESFTQKTYIISKP